MKQDSAPIDEARLHALVDGRLSAAGREHVQALLAADPDAARTAQAWQAQRHALRALHAEVLQEPVPPALAEAARHIGHEGRRLDRWQRWGGTAASVALAFVVGWLAHMQWGGSPGELLARGSRPLNDFGRQAVAAHVVYSPEVRHPVEVPAAQQEHLVQWLSKRLGRSLKVPDLSAQGYELVGGRLLPGEQGARAQFMYQNARAERITLYVGAIDAGKAGRAAAGETAFRFTHEDGAASFYWVAQGFGYALAGRMDKGQLLPLAESVYRQL
ncbi:anti-sigma factor [Ramlibacter tataouinensis]|uniref:anti-sigma factor family protein n=1 Tax=Ramlibacter tataouinensis TaxID=94132 RepID=UPI0022F3A124|nr:anti-sigma factor [Ramlibacter tataouinensis]WBY02048.1 anti-sigma factor [Ramlibacter tataouinensis]